MYHDYTYQNVQSCIVVVVGVVAVALLSIMLHFRLSADAEKRCYGIYAGGGKSVFFCCCFIVVFIFDANGFYFI